MALREEFVRLAMQAGSNELCRASETSPKTAYEWLVRYALEAIESTVRPLPPAAVALWSLAKFP